MRSTATHGSSGRLVRVLNPSWLGQLLGESRDDETKHLRARPGTPKTVAELGGLVEIALDADSAKPKTLSALKMRAKPDERGDTACAFNPKQIRLVADANGDLHIVGFYVKPPEGFQPGRSQLLGRAVAVTYRSDAEGVAHEHEFCEHGGDCPKLYFKDGYLLFRGGTYSVTPEGLLG